MSLRDLSKKITNSKTHINSTAQDIFKAQENNKVNVCKYASRKFLEKTENENQILSSEKRDELIRKYAYLVNWIVSRLPVNSLKGMEREDLIGYGTIGLIEAVDRFDPSRNSKFQSFAIARIRGSIYDQLRASDWLSRGSRKKVKNLYKVISDLENKLSRCPTDKEIAGELSITLGELRVIQQEAQIATYSLDEPKEGFSDDSHSLVDTVSSNEVPILEEIEELELKERLTKAIDGLPERERTVVGLYHYKKLTFKEIAEILDFSESRASQVHARAISLLKSKMLKD